MPISIQPRRRPECIVVVPCYNEAQRLDVHAFDHFLCQSAEVMLLIVDDGSTDDTPLIAERLRQRRPRQVCTLRLNANVGKAEAVRRGIQAALRRRPTMVGYWDADLSTPLDAISRLCGVLRERPELNLVMGSRVALLGRRIRRRPARHFLGRTFATAASLVLGLAVYDTQCGAKVFRATPATAELFSRPFQARWIFDVEILARMTTAANANNERPADELVCEYPLETWTDVAGTRLRPIDFLIAAVDLLRIYSRYRRRLTPNKRQGGAPGVDVRELPRRQPKAA